ncbi:Uncharacterised protein [uncultured archaeon]|nr:Uncharacterised protein [uncultured archaeon]
MKFIYKLSLLIFLLVFLIISLAINLIILDQNTSPLIKKYYEGINKSEDKNPPHSSTQVQEYSEKSNTSSSQNLNYIKELDLDGDGNINDDIIRLWMDSHLKNTNNMEIYNFISNTGESYDSGFNKKFDLNSNGEFDDEDFNQLLNNNFANNTQKILIEGVINGIKYRREVIEVN